MKYKLSITIQKPIKEVVKLYANRGLLSQWQPGLMNSKQIENYPHPKYTHQLALGRRKIILTESILRNDLPEHYDIHFELKGLNSHVYNSFEETSAQTTRWHCETTYHFKGLMKIISLFNKSSLKKQSEMIMVNFKRFVESR